jgi:hypothetical protein
VTTQKTPFFIVTAEKTSNLTLNNAVFWKKFIAYIIRGTTLALISNGIAFLQSLLQLLVTANVVPSKLIPYIVITEAVRSSKTSVLTRATRRHIPEDDILHGYRNENLRLFRHVNTGNKETQGKSHSGVVTRWRANGYITHTP